MSYNTRCPSCNALCIAIEDHQFFPRAGGVVLWRSCNECGYKWREGYTLTLTHKALPWTKPPHLDDDGEELDE